MNPQAEALKKRTFQFGLAILNFCRALRSSWEGRHIAEQLFRSATSVGANYRAACRARSHAEFVAKLGIAVEEIDETLFWLEMIALAELPGTSHLLPHRREAGELFAILVASQITARANAARRKRLRRTASPQKRAIPNNSRRKLLPE